MKKFCLENQASKLQCPNIWILLQSQVSKPSLSKQLQVLSVLQLILEMQALKADTEKTEKSDL